jgi:hypothetical protein
MIGVGVTVGVKVAMGVAGRGVAVARGVGGRVMLADTSGVGEAWAAAPVIGVARRPQPARIKLNKNHQTSSDSNTPLTFLYRTSNIRVLV